MPGTRHTITASVASAAGALALVIAGLSSAANATARLAQQAPGARADAGTTDEQVARAICTPCHKFSPPDVLPRWAWRDEIARMHLIREGLAEPGGAFATTTPEITLPPDMERAARYYEAHAPERLPDPEPWPAVSESRLRFTHRSLKPPETLANQAVANVQLVDLDGDDRLELLAADMRYGFILKGRPYEADAPPLEVLARLSNPCHVQHADFDRDGVGDLLVADLGAFLPSDHERGGIAWLRPAKDGTWLPLELTGMPRVADVQPADFDGDGDHDLVVAAFGWRKVGNISILENQTKDYSAPSFVPHLVDPRPGSIHVPPVDINGDKRPDFIALVAQQFEQVAAYVNDGGFRFTQQVIYEGDHPNWGSSGIQVVDLDRDGDLDVLLAHGDTFDDQIVKPYHGILWLENEGRFPFTAHHLAKMPGAHRALAADLDGDDDLDIVASALVSGGGGDLQPRLPSLVWLEQVKPQVFERRTLEMGLPRHATLAVGDFDKDGDVDIVVGNFLMGALPTESWVDVWVNELTK